MTIADGRPDILIAGVPITSIPLLGESLLDLVVNSNMHMPSMFVMRFLDDNELGTQPAVTFRWMDKPVPFIIGAPVVITAYGAGEGIVPEVGPLITGEITAIEAEFGPNNEAILVVRGYDRSHRLRMGKNSTTFMFQNATAVVAQVCAKAGVPVVPMPTTVIHEHLLQNNQSDWDFLHGLARRNGFDMVVDNLGILQFQPKGVPVVRGMPAVLTWGDNLTTFNVRFTSADMTTTAMVNAWDAKLKMPAMGVAPVLPVPPGGGPMAIADMGLAMSFFGINNEVVSDSPVGLPTEPQIMALGRAKEVADRFVKADGECKGTPRLFAGCKATVLGVGLRFSGPYTISSATHIFTEGGMHYTTRFSITGSEPDTLGGLLDGKDDNKGRINGVMVGTVTNNLDQLGQGRVKVMLPNLGMVPPVESAYARLAMPGAGMMSGMYWIPEIGDEVLLAFEHGDPNKPYVVGGLWSVPQLVPKPSAVVVVGGKVTERIIKSSSGQTITFSDFPGKEGITLSDKLGLSKIEFDTTKKAVTISVLGDVTIECLNFKVNAKANVELKGLLQANFEGTAGMMLKGAVPAQIELKSKVNVNNGGLEVM